MAEAPHPSLSPLARGEGERAGVGMRSCPASRPWASARRNRRAPAQARCRSVNP